MQCDEDFEEQHRGASQYVESPEDWVVSSWQHPANNQDAKLSGGSEAQSTASTSAVDGTETIMGFDGGLVVKDGLAGPMPRAVTPPPLPQSPKSLHNLHNALITGVPLPLLRALGIAATMLPDEDLTINGFDGSDETNDEISSSHEDSEAVCGKLRGCRPDNDGGGSGSCSEKGREHEGGQYRETVDGGAASLFPLDFVAHPHVRRLLTARRAMVDDLGDATKIAAASLSLTTIASVAATDRGRGGGREHEGTTEGKINVGTGNKHKISGAGGSSGDATPLGVDWGMAELLAFGSLLLHHDVSSGGGEGIHAGAGSSGEITSCGEGAGGVGGIGGDTSKLGSPKPHCHVRLSGQDVERGTFNHRHSVLYCQKLSQPVNPLANLGLGHQDSFMVC